MPNDNKTQLEILANKARLAQLAAKARQNNITTEPSLGVGEGIEQSSPSIRAYRFLRDSIVKPTAIGAKDIAVGAGKEIGSEILQLGGLVDQGFSALTGAPQNPMVSDWQKRLAVNEENPAEEFGSVGTSALSYFLSAAPELKAYEGVKAATTSPKVVNAMAHAGIPGWLRSAIIGTEQAAAGTAIGAAGGAGSAYLHREDPEVGALWGGGTNAATQALSKSGVGPYLGEKIKSGARTMMARALEPGSTWDKSALKRFLDPLLESGKRWFSHEGLVGLSEKEIQASRMRQALVEPAESALLTRQSILDPMDQKATEMYRTGRAGGTFSPQQYSGPTGTPIPLTKMDKDALEALQKDVIEYLDANKQVDAVTGEEYYPWPIMVSAKRKWQDILAEHNAFVGAPDATLSAQLKAFKVAEGTTRNALQDFAGDEWANENSLQHMWLTIKDLASSADIKGLGKKVAPFERPLTGLGSHRILAGQTDDKAGIVMRAIRYMTDKPWFNMMGARSLYNLSKVISSDTGYNASQILNWMANAKENPESIDQPLPPEPLPPEQAGPKPGTRIKWTAPGSFLDLAGSK